MNPFALVADMLADWLRRAFTLDARNRAAVRARREAARVAEAQAAHAERLARMRAEVAPIHVTLSLDGEEIHRAMVGARVTAPHPWTVGPFADLDDETAADLPGSCPDCGVTGGHAAWCRGTAAKPGAARRMRK